MLELLHRHVLIPAYETVIRRRKTLSYWRELERSQWLSRGEIEQIQFDSLRSLVSHALSNCAYYARDWRSRGLSLKALQQPADFLKWPVITRDTIRAHRIAMRSHSPGHRLISKSTGGSSGVPLHFDIDANSAQRRFAAWHRGYSWAGAAPGTRQFYLWGVDQRPRTLGRKWKEDFHDRLYRKRSWNVFDLTERRIAEVLDSLNRARPDAVIAYTKPLYELARLFEERGVRPHRPRSIIVGAEKLHDFEREQIERVFAAPVFETYGSREFMLIGAECDRHRGMHLNMEHLLIEILDADGLPTAPGEKGEVVITDLHNFGMPFIRYATGDCAIAGWDTCSCGRGLPLLRKIIGRQLDILRTPDGRLIPGEFFPHLVKDFRAIRRFQVVQQRPDSVVLRVVTDATWDAETSRHLQSLVRQTLGPIVNFEILTVADIPLTATGKHRVVISNTAEAEAA